MDPSKNKVSKEVYRGLDQCSFFMMISRGHDELPTQTSCIVNVREIPQNYMLIFGRWDVCERVILNNVLLTILRIVTFFGMVSLSDPFKGES